MRRYCPKCGSSRVRRGYSDTHWLLRLIGIYNFLCDNCNLLFTGFALPGTVPPRGRHRRRRRKSAEARRAAGEERAPRPR